MYILQFWKPLPPNSGSFSPRSSGTSRRSAAQPLGEVRFPSVRLGNVLAARTMILILVAASLQCWWLFEQPQGSMFEHHPIVQQVLQMLDVWRHRFAMRTYGAPTEKPTWLYSSYLVDMISLQNCPCFLSPQYPLFLFVSFPIWCLLNATHIYAMGLCRLICLHLG